MLEADRLIFEKTINIYMLEIVKFISERMAPQNYDECLTIQRGIKNGREYVKSIAVHINEQQFKDQVGSSYKVNIKEKVIPIGDSNSNIFTKKYTYEIFNENDETDYVRFDYMPYPTFPHLHINAYEQKWGNHLTYPESTNLDLVKLDVIKALNIFQKYCHNPEDHILDQDKNAKYVSIINGGKKH
ncbi:hypothetical protein JZO78_04240 [Enterococcus ureilyticus]|uniref:hypothetical protein n=1 Tax=Enterococcus ureilyticus TaxID=1131292 RepID=UPI001A93A27A|nr:hypothetical protein [Enterococcus ureilyticus]MBO0445544.1 hypothetical protein [Enterococcus ureilyticus]